ncbi:S-4TM family putative pore-forming effector [Micromonospora tulbaghiae]|uniref:S-4TM family putative pore-forming effector n=1 Tax=Micromonospora tulbaghiae TaxID=479978 RepID=UPI00340F0A70
MTAAHPSIAHAQNSERALTLLAAQRRLYSDAKSIQGIRLLITAVGAVGGVAAALAFSPWRTSIGIITGLVLLSVSVLGGAREKRKIKEASSVQEELDVMLFGLDWNELCADRPTATTITTAATRHKSDRSDLRNWYPDTGTVPYPMNVLICQNSNLGWGSTAHRAWAATVTGAIVVLLCVSAVITVAGRMGVVEALIAVVVPQLSLFKELYEMTRSNLDAATSKSSAEGKVLSLWRRGLTNPAAVTIGDCRAVQDKVLQFRQSGASIPDWFHNRLRPRQEATMRATASHLISEARAHGIA